MYCPNCGAKNSDSSNFCVGCGQKITSGTTQEALTHTIALGPAETDGKAVASLVLGILSVTILSVLSGIPAIFLGHKSRSAIERSAGRLKGAGMAMAGMIMGYISVAMIAIIVIIATIAIPNLLRARQAAQEAAALSGLRTINATEVTYLSSAGGNYGTIRDLVRAGVLDSRFTGVVSGYRFDVAASATEYTASATPTSTEAGRFGYWSTADAVVRYQMTTTSTCNPCFPPGLAGAPVE